MGLRKREAIDQIESIQPDADTVSVEGIEAGLASLESQERRDAVRQVNLLPEAEKHNFADALINLISCEQISAVSEAAFDALTHALSSDSVAKVFTFLESESPLLRNQAIELLQRVPTLLEPHVETLLGHDNPDVRIFTVDILGQLPHEHVPEWVVHVLENDKHINVLGAAVDRATQLSDPRLLAPLKKVRSAFKDEAYLTFACDLAIKRLEE
jgi:HEAT repeat protein